MEDLETCSDLKSVFINERIVEIPFALTGLAKVARGAKILDIGCSESLLPLYLAGAGFHVTGLDFRNYPYDFRGWNIAKAIF